MKNLSMFVLMALAAAAAFGQFGVVVDPAKVNVACPDEECHVAPVFMGSGGFVGSIADGFDEVNYVVTCGNVSTSASAMPDAGGVVRALFDEQNGLACAGMGGMIEVHGLDDGGWYWINDATNSAVSPLLAKDVLGNDGVKPTDPGGVVFTVGEYGTLVQAAGRIGILPHILPEPTIEIPPVPEPEAPTVCMPAWDANNRAFYANANDCMLGDGGTVITMTRMTSDGRRGRLTDSIHRNPGGGSDVEVALQLWGNGSGHVSQSTNPFLGWDVPSGQGRTPESLNAHFWISPNRDGTLGTGLAEMGVELEDGGMVSIPGDPVRVPAPETGDDTATKAREDGFYMDSTTGEPQCTQAVRTVTDGVGGEVNYLQFAARSGDDPVELNAATDAGPGAGDDLDTLATWVDDHNKLAANSKIKTVTVRHGGADGTIGGDNAADDGDHELPAVVCATTPGESTTQFVDATLVISPTTTYCNDDNNRTGTVYVFATRARERNDVIPDIRQTDRPGHWTHTLNDSASLNVHCPAE